MPEVEVSPATTRALVMSRFSNSEALVEEYDAVSSAALQALSTADYSVPMENIETGLPDIVAPNIGDIPASTKPEPFVSGMQPVVLSDLASLQAALNMVEVAVAQVDLPSLDAISPSINLPDAPTDLIPTVDGEAPTISDPLLPAAPGLDLPAVPVLEEVTLPTVPELSFLSFDAALPTADLTPPDPQFIFTEATYQSDLADAVKTKLYNDVVYGGTGLSTEVEADLWARAVERLDYELDKIYAAILDGFGATGFELPDGILAAQLREVHFESTRRRQDTSRDISFKQAELAQQNTQFAITSGMQHEKQLMDFTNQMNQRAFEAARVRVQAVVDIFNAKVAAFTARLEGYKAQAQVYESRIRSELAKVEVYRAQMEGARIHGELQTQKVEIYTKRVQALQTLIDLYRAQMEGAKLHIDVDRVRIDAFRAKIDGVSAQIGAVTAKYNLYQSRIAGETAKVDLYGKQVQAYGTQVGAVKTVADIHLTQAQAQIEANKAKIDLLAAAVDKYKADIQYETSKEETAAKVYTAETGAYDADVRREQVYIQGIMDRYRSQVAEATAQAELLIKEADAHLRTATSIKEIQVEALKSVALIAAQKTASALSSVSASAQLGSNDSISYSNSDSRSVVDSTSKSDSNVNSVSSSDSRSVSDSNVNSVSQSDSRSTSVSDSRSVSDVNSTSQSNSSSNNQSSSSSFNQSFIHTYDGD